MGALKMVVTLIGWTVASAGVQSAPVAVTHSELQAVDAAGNSLFVQQGIDRVQIEGILLNGPEQWLDPTPDPTVAPWYMGGEWEVFIQGEGDDHAGTSCWIGQNYANGPGDVSYTNAQWLHEIERLNHDPQTGYVFRPGDRVRVTGRYLFYAGKLNINENHDADPFYDFQIELVEPAAGLPQPETVRVADLKDAGNRAIFDAGRLTGGEYYQARLVRLHNVTIQDPDNWGPNRDLTVADANGLTFPTHLCLGHGFSKYACPEGQIDVIGIMDQKAQNYDLRTGYRVLVMDYDGNGLVLGHMTRQRGNLPGDLNGDYRVDEADAALLAQTLGQVCAGLAESN